MKRYPSRHCYGCAPVRSPDTLPRRRSNLTTSQRVALAGLAGCLLGLLVVAVVVLVGG
jgi:hypothetical protein